MIDTAAVVDSIMVKLSRSGLDAYEVFSVFSKGLTIEIKESVLDVFVAAENAGLSVRALKDQRLGFAYCTDLSSGALSNLIDRVVQGATSTDPDPLVGFPSPSKETQPQLEQFDYDLATIPVERKIDRARGLERAARSCDPRIKKVRKAGYTETTGTVTICNHMGLRLSYEKTFVSGSILVVAEDGEHAEMGWDYGFY